MHIPTHNQKKSFLILVVAMCGNVDDGTMVFAGGLQATWWIEKEKSNNFAFEESISLFPHSETLQHSKYVHVIVLFVNLIHTHAH